MFCRTREVALLGCDGVPMNRGARRSRSSDRRGRSRSGRRRGNDTELFVQTGPDVSSCRYQARPLAFTCL